MKLHATPGRLSRALHELSERGADIAFGWRKSRSRGRRSGKTVIVHPGFRKTGTTTIQTMLRENEAILAEHIGVVMRWTIPSSEEMHKAGQKFAAAPSPGTARAVRRAARKISAAIREMPQPVVIVTDENIIGRHITVGDRDIFDIAAAALGIIEEEFSEHDLKIVLTTRERRGWMRSCYNQDVKRHKFAGDLEAWLAAHDGCRDWEEGAKALEGALRAPVRFLPMEDDLAEGRFLGRAMLQIAGLPEDVLEKIVPAMRQNPSLDPAQLNLIREINALDLSYRVTGQIVDAIRRHEDLFRAPVEVVDPSQPSGMEGGREGADDLSA